MTQGSEGERGCREGEHRTRTGAVSWCCSGPTVTVTVTTTRQCALSKMPATFHTEAVTHVAADAILYDEAYLETAAIDRLKTTSAQLDHGGERINTRIP